MSLTYFIAYHLIVLAVFVGAVVTTWKTVSQLRSEALALSGRLPFVYYSSSAWVFWALQYLVLIAWTLWSMHDHGFRSAVISIGLVGNALWAVAIGSLYSKMLNHWALKRSYVSVFLIAVGFLILAALVSSLKYENEILASTQFAPLGGLFCLIIFGAFALAIYELRLKKLFVVVFSLHGVSQILWLWLFNLSSIVRLALLVVFPLWHIAVFLSWTKLTPQFLQMAQSDKKEARSVNRLVVMLKPFIIMVSSTFDLILERKAADIAIRELHLDGFLAEKYESIASTPRDVCEFVAMNCDMFILIIGERYGHVPEGGGISVVQLEYEAARADSPQKILAYVKEGVIREEVRLLEFLKVVENYNSGHFRSSFTSPTQLGEKIQQGIMKWLVSRARLQKR